MNEYADKIFGNVQLGALSHELETPIVYPKTVRGRICHVDADFLAYQVSSDPESSFEEMHRNIDTMIKKLLGYSASEEAVLYLTPAVSNKGNRREIALQKPYQENRAKKEKPEFLEPIREWMHKKRDAVMCIDYEADDALCMAWNSTEDKNKCIIASLDKDLLMVPGYALNWGSMTIEYCKDEFGWIELDTSKSAKKIIERGTKFFWSQMLTGDPVDNIQGLPKACLSDKTKLCGPVLSFSLLNNCTNDAECLDLVYDLYMKFGEVIGYVNYRTQDYVSAQDVFESEAKLLWMRRHEDEQDVIKWLENYLNYQIYRV